MSKMPLTYLKFPAIEMAETEKLVQQLAAERTRTGLRRRGRERRELRTRGSVRIPRLSPAH
jgi:hypothetical protein